MGMRCRGGKRRGQFGIARGAAYVGDGLQLGTIVCCRKVHSSTEELICFPVYFVEIYNPSILVR